jgi:hypothetical protein
MNLGFPGPILAVVTTNFVWVGTERQSTNRKRSNPQVSVSALLHIRDICKRTGNCLSASSPVRCAYSADKLWMRGPCG